MLNRVNGTLQEKLSLKNLIFVPLKVAQMVFKKVSTHTLHFMFLEMCTQWRMRIAHPCIETDWLFTIRIALNISCKTRTRISSWTKNNDRIKWGLLEAKHLILIIWSEWTFAWGFTCLPPPQTLQILIIGVQSDVHSLTLIVSGLVNFWRHEAGNVHVCFSHVKPYSNVHSLQIIRIECRTSNSPHLILQLYSFKFSILPLE